MDNSKEIVQELNRLFKEANNNIAKTELIIAEMLDGIQSIDKDLKYIFKNTSESHPKYSRWVEMREEQKKRKAKLKNIKAENKKFQKITDKNNAKSLIVFLEAGFIQ